MNFVQSCSSCSFLFDVPADAMKLLPARLFTGGKLSDFRHELLCFALRIVQYLYAMKLLPARLFGGGKLSRHARL